MTIKKGLSFMERWNTIAEYCKKGKRYRITCYDGSIYEGDFRSAHEDEDDISVDIDNVRDFSPDPRFDGCRYFGIDSSEIASIEEVS